MIDNFADHFFENEIREGFFVAKEMKCAWAAQMEVLVNIDKFCRKNEIKYFADCGTLLGAVRHKGFIPWDDDIDICMERKDYLKFVAMASQGLPYPMKLLSVYNSDWEEAFIRVVNNTKVDFSQEHLKIWHGCPWVVGIDIFPLDVLPDIKEEREVLLVLTDSLRILKGNLCDSSVEIWEEKQVEYLFRQIEELYGVQIDGHESLAKQLSRIRDKLAMSYYGESGSTVASLLYNSGNRVFEREWFAKVQYFPFENIEIPVPENYHAVLQVIYGDYMKAVRNMNAHDYPFYAGQMSEWEKYQKEKGKGYNANY